jgi:hypothetical protein
MRLCTPSGVIYTVFPTLMHNFMHSGFTPSGRTI